jgi:hypothetical protein
MTPSASTSVCCLAAVLTVSVLLGGCATSTYGTGEAPEMAILREVTGGMAGGLVGTKKKEPIQYQPRAPLVMPASTAALPAQVETADAADPRWPTPPKPVEYDPGNDPIAAQAEHQRLKPLAGLGARKWKVDDGRRPLDPYEARRQNKEFKAALAGTETYGDGGEAHQERRYLTEPPESLREPAPTAPTEFSDIKKKRTGFFGRLLGGG